MKQIMGINIHCRNKYVLALLARLFAPQQKTASTIRNHIDNNSIHLERYCQGVQDRLRIEEDTQCGKCPKTHCLKIERGDIIIE